jgi:hypothetical protein
MSIIVPRHEPTLFWNDPNCVTCSLEWWLESVWGLKMEPIEDEL